MFKPPQDVEGECNARLFLADDYGDNTCTVRCQLPKGHDGPHREEFERGGKPVVVTWHVDERDPEDSPHYSHEDHPRRIYGIDFSGAVQAGKKIWITRGVIDGEELRIEGCCQGADLPGSGYGRDRCLAALRDFIGSEEGSAFGLDFPFGLPCALVGESCWEDFTASFATDYPDPEAFRNECRAAADGSELKRVTDQKSCTPFSPYNIRLYRQTYYGIRDLLAPLVQKGLACVLPMQPALPGRPWVLEICPASTLKQKALYGTGSYKGKGRGRYAARKRILEAVEGTAPLSIPAPLRPAILEDSGGDALDSVVAAFAVFRALRNPGGLAVGGDEAYALEGYVYV